MSVIVNPVCIYIILIDESFTKFLYDSTNAQRPPYDSWVKAIFEDSFGRFWVGAGNILHRMDRERERFRALPVYDIDQKHNVSFPKGYYITTIMEAKSGHLWISNIGGGLHIYDPISGKVDRFDQTKGLDMGDDCVWNIFQSKDGTIWLTGGLLGGKVYMVRPEQEPVSNQIQYYSLTNDQSSPELFLIGGVRDEQNLWIYSALREFMQYDLTKGMVKQYTHDPNNPKSIAKNVIGPTLVDSRNRLWIGFQGEDTTLSLDRFDPKTETFTHVLKEVPIKRHIPSGPAGHGMIEDENGNIWFPTYTNGFYFIHAETDEYEYFPFGLTENMEWNGKLLSGFYKEKNKGIWLSGINNKTNEGYLDYFDLSEKSYTSVELDSGLIQKFVYRIESDELNQLWLYYLEPSGNLRGGLVKYSPETNEFEYFNFYNGKLPVLDLKWMVKSSNGKLWFSTQKSNLLISFDPIKESYVYYPLASSLQFQQTTHNIYSSPEGNYRFQVRATNEDGIMSREMATLEVIISPPWWKTTQAFLLFGFIVLGLIGGMFLLYVRVQRQRFARQEQELQREKKFSERLRQVDKLKDQFLANTSHELRTPLNGIIGLSESMYDDAGTLSPETLRENLALTIASGKRLASLVNDLLDFSKLKNADIALLRKALDLHSLVEVVLRVNRPLVGDKNLQLINAIPKDCPPIDADENRLQQIFHNLVGNAIKFTEHGQVLVGVSRRDEAMPRLVSIQKFMSPTQVSGFPKKNNPPFSKNFNRLMVPFLATLGVQGLG